jgi:hypothetical protein
MKGEMPTTILVRSVLVARPAVQGRITERQLPEAERSMPGITRFYAELDEKPATFLDLLWAFEGARTTRCKARKRTRR